MNIELAGAPERVKVQSTAGEPIRLPLTAEPDRLLLTELGCSDDVKSCCPSVGPAERSLLIVPSEAGTEHVRAMLTTIKGVIDAGNSWAPQVSRTACRRSRAGMHASIFGT